MVVELAAVTDPDLVLTTVARALGLRDAGGRDVVAALADLLHDRRPLLVLDNAEHVLAAAPGIAELLARCPGLTVLATSRAPLRIRAEREYPVAPLAVPDPHAVPDAATVGASPAARMFLDRARRAAATFELTEDNAAAVAAICWRLDGLPLALELVAARARLLGPTALLARIDDAVGAAGVRDLPERQRSMRATLDWSHDLLSEPEQRLLRELAVFIGGFTLDAAQAVTGRDPLEALAGLVEQSLVVADPGEEPRYRMLEPVRQYAAERLAGETAQLQARHATYFRDLGDSARPGLRAGRQREWLDRLQREHGNLRAALAWLVEHDPDGAAVLAGRTWVYWALRGHADEGSRWTERILARELDDHARGLVLGGAAGLRYATGDVAGMAAAAGESLALRPTTADAEARAEAAILFASAEVFTGSPGAGAALALALDAARACGDGWAEAHALTACGQGAVLAGDLDAADRLLAEAETVARAAAGPFTLATVLNLRATVTQLAGDDTATLALLAESTEQSVGAGIGWTLVYSLPALAWVAIRRGEPDRAARLFGAGAALAEAGSIAATFPATVELAERDLAAARDALGEQAFGVAFAAGQELGPHEVAALVAGINRSPAPH